MAVSPIKSATASDEHQTVDVVVRAFNEDPATRWIFPDPDVYESSFPELVRSFAGRAFEENSAYFVEGFFGAALWLPPGIHPDEPAVIALLNRTVPESNQQDVFAVFEQMGNFHPNEPHWYLPLIGVDPDHQGKGYGSALMEHALIPCDRENKLAYLESSNARNVPLYERYGFEVIGSIQAGTSPPIIPMLRKPQ